MAQELKDVELDEVSLVDRPANQFAKVVIMKQDVQKCFIGKDDLAKCEFMKGGVCTNKGCTAKLEAVEKGPAGVQFNIGFKEEGGSEIQSVVFDSGKWTAEKARAWLEEHDLKGGKLDETENTLRFRQKDPKEFARFRMITPGRQVSKALKAKESWSNVQEVVGRALRDKFTPKGEADDMSPKEYVFVRELFKDSVIFEQGGGLYRVDYEIDYEGVDAPTVTFSAKVPQQIVYRDLSKQDPVSDDPPVKEPPADELPQVPAELRFKLGKLMAQVEGVNRRVTRLSKHGRHNQQRHGARRTTGGGGGGFSSGNESFDLQTTGEGRKVFNKMSERRWERGVGSNAALFDKRTGTQVHQIKVDPQGLWQHKMWTGGRGSGRVMGKGKGWDSLSRNLERRRI
jgi:hypothetical protein